MPVIKIADFGLAKLIGAESKAATFCGTPQYFAPEVLDSRNHRKGYDDACDMWSVGVLMYILLSGSPPFENDDTTQRPLTPEGAGPGSAAADGAFGGGNAAAVHNRQQPGAASAASSALSIFDKIREGISRAHFVHTVWEDVSPAAKHLICEMLVVDPRRRCTVSDALAHPWMRGETTVDFHVPRLPGGKRNPFGPQDNASPGGDEIEESDEEEEGGGADFRPRFRPSAGGYHEPPFAKRQRKGGPAQRALPLTTHPPPPQSYFNAYVGGAAHAAPHMPPNGIGLSRDEQWGAGHVHTHHNPHGAMGGAPRAYLPPHAHGPHAHPPHAFMPSGAFGGVPRSTIGVPLAAGGGYGPPHPYHMQPPHPHLLQPPHQRPGAGTSPQSSPPLAPQQPPPQVGLAMMPRRRDAMVPGRRDWAVRACEKMHGSRGFGVACSMP